MGSDGLVPAMPGRCPWTRPTGCPFHSNGNTTESMGVAKPILRALPTAPRRGTPAPLTGGEVGPGTPRVRILPQEVRNTQDPKTRLQLIDVTHYSTTQVVCW